MIKTINILIILVLGFSGCDFADYKLSFVNKTNSAIIIKARLVVDNTNSDIYHTGQLVESNSTEVLPLLNRDWESMYKEFGGNAILKLYIVYISIDEFDYKNKHYHEFFRQKISDKNYYHCSYTRDELDNLNWKITFPSNKIRKAR